MTLNYLRYICYLHTNTNDILPTLQKTNPRKLVHQRERKKKEVYSALMSSDPQLYK